MDTGYLNMDSGQLSVKVENSSDKRGLIINIEEYRAKEKDSHKELFPFFVKKCYIEHHRYKGNLSFPSKEVNISICHYVLTCTSNWQQRIKDIKIPENKERYKCTQNMHSSQGVSQIYLAYLQTSQ